MTPEVAFTTLHFLHNLQMGPVSQSVCSWQAFPAKCKTTFQLNGPICNLQRKLCVDNMTPEVVFTTLHFLHNLQMGLVSQSVCSWEAFPNKCETTFQLNGPICNLQRKLCVDNMTPEVVFTTLHFLHNLQMGPVSQSVCN